MIRFTWDYLREQFEQILSNGHEVLTVQNYQERVNHEWFLHQRHNIGGKFLINRVDVDVSLEKAEKVASMFNNLGIRGTFFIRLHEYNVFGFKNYRILKFIQESGHEIGLHTELTDFWKAVGTKENEQEYSWDDLEILRYVLGQGKEILSCADHQDNRTPHTNIKPENYSLYDADKITDDIITVTDSDWTNWKVYQHGKRWAEPCSISELSYSHDRIYSIIHPCTYYKRHVFDD